jgi:plastocyanin
MRIATIVIGAALLFLSIPNPGVSQVLHVIVASGMTFTPSDLTISVGDTVRWENHGGFHNVLADDGSFTNGPPSSSAWTYTRVFTFAGNFQYYCEIHGAPGGVGMSGIIRVSNPTGVMVNIEQPDRLKVKQNFPNPFNHSTTIGYALAQNDFVSIKVFDILGEELATIVNGKEFAGYHEIKFDAANLPSGIYFYKVQSRNATQIKKMLLLK